MYDKLCLDTNVLTHIAFSVSWTLQWNLLQFLPIELLSFYNLPVYLMAYIYFIANIRFSTCLDTGGKTKWNKWYDRWTRIWEYTPSKLNFPFDFHISIEGREEETMRQGNLAKDEGKEGRINGRKWQFEKCLLSSRYWSVVGVASIYRRHRNHCYFIVNGNAPA